MTLQLGDIAPDFEQDSTEGRIHFYKWKQNNWAILFSHPKNFTPVCTTELGQAAKLKAEFEKKDVKIIGLSVDELKDHYAWIGDIEETQGSRLNFPLLADFDRSVSDKYGMIHPNANNTFTVRSVFIVDPANKIRLIMTYPASTGRNFIEILRVVESLQLTDQYKVATPVNWKPGEDVIIVPSLVDEAEIKQLFPKGHTTIKPYLRITPQPDL